MLRLAHMPSDFHPVFLILGDAEDLGVVAEALRTFAQEGRELTLQLPSASNRTTVLIAPADGEFGMRKVRTDTFCWYLNAWQAERIAERIDLLTPAENKSGSDILELGVEGEIPVKISRGEFTEDFLVRKF